MVYHSSLADQAAGTMCSCPILPLRDSIRGPAPNLDTPSTDGAVQEDIVDEVLRLFRANVLFKSFEVTNAADRLLVYLTLYTTLCLKSMVQSIWILASLDHHRLSELAESKPDRSGAERALTKLAHEGCALPGEPGFPLGGLMSAPQGAHETEFFRAYLKQLREALGMRLVARCYADAATTPSKYWLAFANRGPTPRLAS